MVAVLGEDLHLAAAREKLHLLRGEPSSGCDHVGAPLEGPADRLCSTPPGDSPVVPGSRIFGDFPAAKDGRPPCHWGYSTSRGRSSPRPSSPRYRGRRTGAGRQPPQRRMQRPCPESTKSPMESSPSTRWSDTRWCSTPSYRPHRRENHWGAAEASRPRLVEPLPTRAPRKRARKTFPRLHRLHRSKSASGMRTMPEPPPRERRRPTAGGHPTPDARSTRRSRTRSVRATAEEACGEEVVHDLGKKGEDIDAHLASPSVEQPLGDVHGQLTGLATVHDESQRHQPAVLQYQQIARGIRLDSGNSAQRSPVRGRPPRRR